jgi:DNA (cytosine-5)-methyltransferase 1
MKSRNRHLRLADSGLMDPAPMSPEEINELLGLRSDEIIIDMFAGGGGASTGIEWALGRSPDEAVNHSPAAIAIHRLNHPNTRHHETDAWEADPIVLAAGRRVGLLWLSPDCTHFSRAKGARPVSKKIRVLAHVAVRYAKAVRPRVIMLENVPEFLSWGPVSRITGKPDPRRKGHSFRAFTRQLRREGYEVEWRVLRGCDFGAPTTRERLFLIARCDGASIRWPQPTHGPGLLPYRTAAECIDFSIPCPSIFLTTKEANALGRILGRRIIRPLKYKTMRRVARGTYRFVIDAAEPFIVPVTHAGDDRSHAVTEPLRTITGANRGELAVVDATIAPYLIPRYGEDPHRNGGAGQDPRCLPADQPFPTIVPTANGAQLVSAFLAKHYGEKSQRPGSGMAEPIGAITGVDHHSVVAVHLSKFYGTAKHGQKVSEPIHTVAGGGGHAALVAAFLVAYYGNERDGGRPSDPMRTVTSNDRFALVIVTIDGVTYAIIDIGMRMLTARELANGQGFPAGYILEGRYPTVSKKGVLVSRRITETDQKKMIGNSVNPQIPRALLLANFGVPSTAMRAA